MPTSPTSPEIDAVLNDPAASYWLRDALRAALQRDPVDAAHDAACLAALLQVRADAALAIARAALGR